MPTTSLSTLLSGTMSANFSGCLPGLGQGRRGSAVGAEPGAVFTSLLQLSARLWDTALWRNCHSSGNNLQPLSVFHQLGPCQSPFTGPSLLFLSLIPLKYATDHFALLL